MLTDRYSRSADFNSAETDLVLVLLSPSKPKLGRNNRRQNARQAGKQTRTIMSLC